MSGLKAEIDKKSATITFSGSTFQFKEQIKSLGGASWNAQAKAWVIALGDLEAEVLRELFPGIEIVESAEALATTETPVEESSALLSLTSLSSNLAEPPSLISGTLPDSLSVRELSEGFRRLLSSAFPGVICVRGVLTQVKEQRGGRIFMDLAEDGQPEYSVSCVIWSDGSKVIKPLLDAGFKLEADLQVMFQVAVSFNGRGSRISLKVVGVIPEYTVAKAAALRELTNERLKKEGLFDKNKSLTLAFLPIRLGLLTSAGGTVIHDARASLDEAKFGFQLYWAEASVQGKNAKRELLRALSALAAIPQLDAILIFRGGGSAGDLAVFSDYEVAKAICLCPLPVISAIGHQEDQSSVQDVSFRAFGVPKDIGRFFADLVRDRRFAVAEFARVISEQGKLKQEMSLERLKRLATGIAALGSQVLIRYTESLDTYRKTLPESCRREIAYWRDKLAAFYSPLSNLSSRVIAFERRELALVSERLKIEASRAVADANFRLGALEKLLAGASPKVQLERGFVMVRRSGAGFIKSSSELRKDDLIELEFVDARKSARVID